MERKSVSREVRAEIVKAKSKYRENIEKQYVNGDLRAAWRGIKSMATINQYGNEPKQQISLNSVQDDCLPDVFNTFFLRFETSDFMHDVSRVKNSLTPCSDIKISQEQVEVLFKKTKKRKASGPDLICGHTLHHCAGQLSGVFSHLFQMCVDNCKLPNIWKASIVIPIPKINRARELQDFRPVALTSLVVKNLEKILKEEVLILVEGKLDSFQFAYQRNKGVDDAKLFILDTLYKHLEKPQSHARLLFADFSSAFNKMQPLILIERLASYFNLSDQLLALFLNFLTDRTQRVLVNGVTSKTQVSNTGSPQGCVLSPLLFILYTDSCRSFKEDSFLVKFSDDTALLSLLHGTESDHGSALPDFVKWCDDSLLDLNVSKTKELIIDFRKKGTNTSVCRIHGEDVEIVNHYKYLGTVFDSQLKFERNSESVVKRAQQRVHLLRRINSFGVSKSILCTVYLSYIESLLTFSFICWFGNISVKDRNCLNNIVKVCSKIIGIQMCDLNSLWEKRVLEKVNSLMKQHHILGDEFVLMPSGRRYLEPPRKTNRYGRSFIPSAIRLLNIELRK